MLSQWPQMPSYTQLPLKLVSGSGTRVVDEKGDEYLDMYGGHAVSSVGHSHPYLVEALKNQAETLFFYSNVVDVPGRMELSQRLVEMAYGNMHGVFLCNSGAEANENALTLARFANQRKTIVSVEGGFHGRSLLTLSISGIEGYRKRATVGETPLFPMVRVLGMNDVAAVSEVIDEQCAAVIVEPVQGIAGAIACTPEFLAALRTRCDETGCALIFDEVQCGTGRCGCFTAAEAFGVAPDMITMAKGLGGGFPIGAVLANEKFCGQIKANDLGSTFGGGPLACAAANAVLDIIEQESLLANVREVSAYLVAEVSKVETVVAIHGKGFLLGIEMNADATKIKTRLREEFKIITGGSIGPEVIRILPPLTLNLLEAEQFVSAFKIAAT